MHNDMRSKFAVAVTKFKPHSNLDVMDRLGLWWLQVNGFVVVKDDKGNSLIPMRRDFKLGMTVALASDPTQFALQQPDRLGVFLAVNHICSRLRLPKRVADLLTNQTAFEDWPVHNIEYTWKSHKAHQSARCITPTTRSPLTPLAKVLQRHLRPIVAGKPSVVTCTREVVTALDGLPVPHHVWLGVGDIKDFYPSTCPTQACDIIKAELVENRDAHERHDIHAIVEALAIVLNNQFVKAGDSTYRCLKIGQGLACASEVCDLVASRTLDHHPQVSYHIQSNMLWYGRFRDDCLVIWTGPDDERFDFEQAFGTANPRYVCKWEWSQDEVTFLDLSIRVQDGRLRLSTHFKPTNLFRYIPPWSCHASSIFSSWIQGELQRYIVTNSRLEDFLQVRDAFMERLCACGYGKPFIMQVFSRDVCQYTRRATLLQQNGLSRERCVALCMRFHPILECMRIHQWLHDWQERIHTALKSRPRFVVAFKRGQHLIHTLRNGVQTNCAEGGRVQFFN